MSGQANPLRPPLPDALRLGLRFVGFAVGIGIGWQSGAFLGHLSDERSTRDTLLLLTIAIGGIGYVLGPYVSVSVIRNLRRAIGGASTLELVAITAGLIVGGVISALLAVPLSLLPDPIGQLLPFVAGLIVVSLAIGVALARKRDLIAPWLRGQASATPAPAAAAPARPAGVLLDTSVIIDGRLAEVIGTGFFEHRLLVPRFVLEELQFIADSDDPLRRARGRRGLDALSRMRQEAPKQVEIMDSEREGGNPRAVDIRLVRLAKERSLRILTNDYNLDRVAELQGVKVLNLHELAGALRPQVLPGEALNLKLVQDGREAGQGVGFLDDGTMVVVEGGRSLVGQETNVTVTRLLQTGAGRLVFAVPTDARS